MQTDFQNSSEVKRKDNDLMIMTIMMMNDDSRSSNDDRNHKIDQ